MNVFAKRFLVSSPYDAGDNKIVREGHTDDTGETPTSCVFERARKTELTLHVGLAPKQQWPRCNQCKQRTVLVVTASKEAKRVEIGGIEENCRHP